MFSVLKVREGIASANTPTRVGTSIRRGPWRTNIPARRGPIRRAERGARQAPANRSRCSQAAAEFRFAQSSMRTLP